MSKLPRSGPTFVLAALSVLSLPATANADLFVARRGESVVPLARRVIVVHHGMHETLIESVEITSTAPRFLWFRAFPVTPQVQGGRAALFEALEKNTVVEEPFNEQIRGNLFGPSVVTVLTHRLADRMPPEEDTPEPQRDTVFEDPRVFGGRVTTSTITFELQLPEGLARWLVEQDLTMDDDQKREIARYLNRDWQIVGVAVTDPAPTDGQRARLGPIRYDFTAPSPIYPQMGLDYPWLRTPPASFYLLGDTPLAPSTLRTVWDTRSWEMHPKQRSSFVATYSQPLDPDGTIAFELNESDVAIPEKSFLVRASYERGRESLVDLGFVAADDAVLIPGTDHRASGTDVFLCILLGLTPLIYTPESWFLLWLAARARARARKEGKAFGTKLWSVYAIVVAIFWFVTLEGVGRLAGLAPMVIGIVQLAIPYAEREPRPVRVQFRKKKA